jgi:hypothetical protein
MSPVSESATDVGVGVGVNRALSVSKAHRMPPASSWSGCWVPASGASYRYRNANHPFKTTYNRIFILSASLTVATWWER